LILPRPRAPAIRHFTYARIRHLALVNGACPAYDHYIAFSRNAIMRQRSACA